MTIRILSKFARRFRRRTVRFAQSIWRTAVGVREFILTAIFFIPELGAEIYHAVLSFAESAYKTLSGAVQWVLDLFVALGSDIYHGVRFIVEWLFGWI